jgi:transcriptional regulator with XRE-family HTH domain
MFLSLEIDRTDKGFNIVLDGEILKKSDMHGGIKISLPAVEKRHHTFAGTIDVINSGVFKPIVPPVEMTVSFEAEEEAEDESDHDADECEEQQDENASEEESGTTVEEKKPLGIAVIEKIKEYRKLTGVSIAKIAELLAAKTGKSKSALSQIFYGGIHASAFEAAELGKILGCEIVAGEKADGKPCWDIHENTATAPKENAEPADIETGPAKRYLDQSVINALEKYRKGKAQTQKIAYMMISSKLGVSYDAVKGMFTRHAMVSEAIAMKLGEILGVEIVIGTRMLNGKACWAVWAVAGAGSIQDRIDEIKSQTNVDKHRAIIGADVKEIMDLYMQHEKVEKTPLSHKVASACGLSQPSVYSMLFSGVTAPECMVKALGEILNIDIYWSEEDDINIWRSSVKMS